MTNLHLQHLFFFPFRDIWVSIASWKTKSCQVLLSILVNSILFHIFCKRVTWKTDPSKLHLAHRKGIRTQYRIRIPVTHTKVSCQLTRCKLALVLLRRFQDTSSSEENRRVTSSSATASHPFLEKYITSARLKHPWCWPAISSSMEVSSLWMIPVWGN